MAHTGFYKIIFKLRGYYGNFDNDPEIAMLQRLLAEKKAMKKQKESDEEM